MRKRQTLVILVLGSALLLLGLVVPAPPSALRLGAKADDAVAQFESTWVPVPDSDRPKYIPYRRFHLSYGSGSIRWTAAKACSRKQRGAQAAEARPADTPHP